MSPTAPLDQPYRGSGADRPSGVPLPPDPMPPVRAGTLLKRWHYVSFWSPDLLLCAAQVHVGPLGQEYWGVWDRREQRFWQGTNWLRRRVSLLPRELTFEDGDVSVHLPFAPNDDFQLYRPEGRAYIWGRKQFCARATAEVRLGSRTVRPQGALFVDMTAGYNARRTRWRWSAGAGTDQRGRAVAWSAIVGLFDTPSNSERTLWVDGVPSELGPVRFNEDLPSVSFSEGGEITFRQEANLRQRVELLLIKSKYDHAFGAYDGTLPGGIRLQDGVGVYERQDALW